MDFPTRKEPAVPEVSAFNQTLQLYNFSIDQQFLNIIFLISCLSIDFQFTLKINPPGSLQSTATTGWDDGQTASGADNAAGSTGLPAASGWA